MQFNSYNCVSFRQFVQLIYLKKLVSCHHNVGLVNPRHFKKLFACQLTETNVPQKLTVVNKGNKNIPKSLRGEVGGKGSLKQATHE